MSDLLQMQSLGEVLRVYRERAGLSRSQLAALLQTSRTTIWNWEQGITRPSKPARFAIARVLASRTGVDEDALLQELLRIYVNGYTRGLDLLHAS